MARVTIKSLGILSVAKMYAILCFLMSLIIAIPYGIIIMIFGAAMGTSGQEGAGGVAAGGIVGGLMIMVLLPIVYAIIGFIGGIIMAAIYNLVANVVGGIEMELEGAGGALLSAPPQFQPGQYQPGQYQQGSYPPSSPY